MLLYYCFFYFFCWCVFCVSSKKNSSFCVCVRGQFGSSMFWCCLLFISANFDPQANLFFFLLILFFLFIFFHFQVVWAGTRASKFSNGISFIQKYSVHMPFNTRKTKCEWIEDEKRRMMGFYLLLLLQHRKAVKNQINSLHPNDTKCERFYGIFLAIQFCFLVLIWFISSNRERFKSFVCNKKPFQLPIRKR